MTISIYKLNYTLYTRNVNLLEYLNILFLQTGDSGGALIETSTGNIIGITSFGTGMFGCDSGAPQGFTHVPEFIPWIERITGITCRKYYN